jgi:flavin reductase (DIM6/NTAB) family NADH-FMN oxidoreductase RutF
MYEQETNRTINQAVPYANLAYCVRTGENSANILTIAWGGVLAGGPPTIGIAVGKSHYSTPFLHKEGNFTINIPNSQQDVVADYCGIVSGINNPNKASTCGFTLVPSTKIPSPLITECPINFECKTYQELDFKGTILFMGEVVETHISESVLDEQGRIVTEKLDPLIFLPNGEYRKIGSFVSKAFSVGRKLFWVYREILTTLTEVSKRSGRFALSQQFV